MRLGAQIINLVGLDIAQDARQVRGVREIPIVQLEAAIRGVRVFVDMVDALGVEERGPALDAMHLIALFEQKLGQVGAILARDTGDERNLARPHAISSTNHAFSP
ncbi:hypothetical protein D3C87_1621500 [compost metagenome]